MSLGVKSKTGDYAMINERHVNNTLTLSIKESGSSTYNAEITFEVEGAEKLLNIFNKDSVNGTVGRKVRPESTVTLEDVKEGVKIKIEQGDNGYTACVIINRDDNAWDYLKHDLERCVNNIRRQE